MKLENIKVIVCLGDDEASLNCLICGVNIDWKEDWETLEEAVAIADNHQCRVKLDESRETLQAVDKSS